MLLNSSVSPKKRMKSIVKFPIFITIVTCRRLVTLRSINVKMNTAHDPKVRYSLLRITNATN